VRQNIALEAARIRAKRQGRTQAKMRLRKLEMALWMLVLFFVGRGAGRRKTARTPFIKGAPAVAVAMMKEDKPEALGGCVNLCVKQVLNRANKLIDIAT